MRKSHAIWGGLLVGVMTSACRNEEGGLVPLQAAAAGGEASAGAARTVTIGLCSGDRPSQEGNWKNIPCLAQAQNYSSPEQCELFLSLESARFAAQWATETCSQSFIQLMAKKGLAANGLDNNSCFRQGYCPSGFTVEAGTISRTMKADATLNQEVADDSYKYEHYRDSNYSSEKSEFEVSLSLSLGLTWQSATETVTCINPAVDSTLAEIANKNIQKLIEMACRLPKKRQ
jgi:hypothetical protein